MRSLPLLLCLAPLVAFACSSSEDAAQPGVVALPEAGPPEAEAGPIAPPAPDGTDYLIVTADSLAASAEKFRAYRETGGHHVAIAKVSDLAGAEEPVAKITAYVKSTYAKRNPAKPFFVLLLGDASKVGVAEGEVPAGTYDDEGTPVTTDNVYADMDGDHLPDLAVGRVAVRTDAEAAVVFEKMRTYEGTYEVGAWNRRLDLFASTSGFGELVDPLIEEMVFKIVEEIPYALDISLTYAKQSSPYVYVPERFSDKVYDRMNDGALMMAYVGHGDTTGFATLEWGGKSFPILDTAQLSTKIAARHRPPILTLIACLTGGFEKGESLSESILKTKDGPSAILSSTEISHPYPNAIFIREIGQVLTTTKTPTVGEIFVASKRRMITESGPLRKELDERVGALVPPAEQASLRQSHLYMYTLFGDPALRVPYVHEAATVTASSAAKVGQTFDVSVTIPVSVGDGQATVTLERGRTTNSPLPPGGTGGRHRRSRRGHRGELSASNDRALVTVEVPFTKGALSTSLMVPADLPAGRYYVKVYANDGKTDAMGSASVDVTPP